MRRLVIASLALSGAAALAAAAVFRRRFGPGDLFARSAAAPPGRSETSGSHPKTGGSAVRKPAASAGGAASAAEGQCGILASFPSAAEGRGPSSGAFPDAAHADPARVSLPVSRPVCRGGTAPPSPGRAALPAGGRRPFHPEAPIFIFLKQNANTGQTNWLYSPFR